MSIYVRMSSQQKDGTLVLIGEKHHSHNEEGVWLVINLFIKNLWKICPVDATSYDMVINIVSST